MFPPNLDIIVEQARQRQQELRAVAEECHRVQTVLRHQPGLFRQTLTYVGERLVISGEWLKAQGAMSVHTRQESEVS